MASTSDDIPKYGMDKELAEKQAAKYDVELERNVVQWISRVTKLSPTAAHVDEDAVHEWLKSGVVLCELLNAIKPNAIPKINTLNSPFKQMENIGHFTKACRKLGVNEKDMFATVSLYEKKNMMEVLHCIYSLSSAIQTSVPDFPGPFLGKAPLPCVLSHDVKREQVETTQFSGYSTSLDVTANTSIPARQQTLSSACHIRDNSPRDQMPQGPDGRGPPSRAPASKGKWPFAQGLSQSRLKSEDEQEGKACDVENTTSCDKKDTTQIDLEVAAADLERKRLEKVKAQSMLQKMQKEEAEAAAVLERKLAEIEAHAAGALLQKQDDKRKMELSTGEEKECATMEAPNDAASLERDVCAWISAVTGTSQDPDKPAHEWLKSGIVLCNLVNAIKPNTIVKINNILTSFKQKENIEFFTDACRALGVHDKYIFATPDLYANRNTRAVLQCVYQLSCAVQVTVPEFTGPILREKYHSVQLNDGGTHESNSVSQASDGSSPLARVKNSRGVVQRQTTAPNFPVQAKTTPSSRSPRAGTTFAKVMKNWPPKSADTLRSQREDAIAEVAEAEGAVPLADRWPLGGAKSSQNVKATGSADSLGVPEVCADSARVSEMTREELPIYGLDKELAAKQAAKYDTELERDVVAWIKALTGSQPAAGETLQQWLKSGIVLCNALNAIKPNAIPKINTSQTPFKQMENIGYFTKACRVLGVNEKDVFATVDLYENKNMMEVLQCIYHLGCAVQVGVPDFTGPTLGKAQHTSLRDKRRLFQFASQMSGFSSSLTLDVPIGHSIRHVPSPVRKRSVESNDK